MESEFAKIIYAKIDSIPWQPQNAKFVSRQKKKTGYMVSICKRFNVSSTDVAAPKKL
jgi:hypothetical protein